MARKPKEPSRTKKRPSFFQILFGDFENTIKLPSLFTKRYEAELKERSILKDPTGTLWYVKMVKIKGCFFFKNNWPRFVKRNSLQCGDLLIFTHIGDSQFIVKMYDKTLCEKDVGLAKNVSLEQSGRECASVEVKAQKTSKHMAVSGKSTFETKPSMKIPKQEELNSPIQEETARLPVVKGGSRSRWQHAISNRKEERAVDIADDPFYEVHLCQTYIATSIMNVPKKLMRRLANIPVGRSKCERENVRLWISDDRSWPVRFNCLSNKAYFCKSWKRFVVDNNLVKGDICKFQLMKTKKRDLKVTFRCVYDN